MTLKIRALALVANELGHEQRDMLSKGFRWSGFHGGDHIISWMANPLTGTAKAVFHVDLVLDKVTQVQGRA
jgi:hypothetical protein